ncbi:MAG: hypothetical protein ACXWDI_11470, partial [Nocardioides sp.]
ARFEVARPLVMAPSTTVTEAVLRAMGASDRAGADRARRTHRLRRSPPRRGPGRRLVEALTWENRAG